MKSVRLKLPSPLLLLGLALLLQLTPAWAQEPVAEAEALWLQVELIVFRQLDTQSAADEKWPARLELSYPSAIEIPRTVEEIAAAGQLSVAAGIDNSFGTTVDSRVDDAGATPSETPFVALAPEHFMLLDASRKLASSSAYRVLRHLAWRQPRPRDKQLVHVLVSGGNAVQDHFELEGYMTLRRAQFMHVDTHLWLNDFSTDSSASANPEGALLPTIPRTAPLIDAALAAVPVDPITATQATIDVPAPLYSVRSVLLEATRRMRLGEVHYIDHPLFGVIMSLRAYDPGQAAVVESDAAPTPAATTATAQ